MSARFWHALDWLAHALHLPGPVLARVCLRANLTALQPGEWERFYALRRGITSEPVSVPSL